MMVRPESSNQMVEHLFRHESGRLLASLTQLLGLHNLAVAEEIVQETLLKALMVWPYHAPVDNPVGWLRRVARHKAIDHLRRHQHHEKYVANRAFFPPPNQHDDGWTQNQPHPLGDELVQMLFVCCTPELSIQDQVALCLQLIGGLSAKEIAVAFLVSHESMRKRLYRAKQHLKKHTSFSLPCDEALPHRIDSVLAVIYLMFNEGYHSQSGDHVLRYDLCFEAMRLLNLLQEHPHLQLSRVHALGALMRFQAARFGTRTDAHGQILLLEEQDRQKWDQAMIQQGFHHLKMAQTAANEHTLKTRYHLEAGIAAYHCTAKHFRDTPWKAILQLYEQLLACHPSPMAQLNHHIVLGYVHGPKRALSALELLKEEPSLKNHYLLYACLGEFATRAHQPQRALQFYEKALHLAPGKAQQQLIKKKQAATEASL